MRGFVPGSIGTALIMAPTCWFAICRGFPIEEAFRLSRVRATDVPAVPMSLVYLFYG